jgi:hypothetical protein
MSRAGWDNADQCARMRTRVQQLVASHWAEALKVATEISRPWYRVQALAAVASAAADERVEAVLEKACGEAARDTDAYRRVAVLAWVIGAAMSRDRTAFAERVLRGAMVQSAAITPMKSRAAALELLLAEAARIGERETRQIAAVLLDVAAALSADPIKKWRKWGVSYVNRTAGILSEDHSLVAEDLLAARFGAERAGAILARHGVRRGR